VSSDDLHKYVDGAVRMTLDSVSFSNPLPPWEDQTEINFGRRAALIHKRADRYMSGAETALSPTRIRVPHKDGIAKTWTIPSVNDQIILQLCAFALSERLERLIDRKHVFSYQLNEDLARVQLTTPQVSCWESFKSATSMRLPGRTMLQLDLEKAFASIDRQHFFRFLREATGDAKVPVLLERVLDRLAPPQEGLPLVNDSLFYLGNAYLTVVDKEIAAASEDFIRFVDDYRIFADSKEHAETLLQRINDRLVRTSFRINPRKTKVGDEREYLSAINEIHSAETTGENGYVSAVELSGVVDPDALAGLIARAIVRSEDLTEGMGRFLMQAVRRMRLNDDLVKGRNFPDSPLTRLGEALTSAVQQETLVAALKKYANRGDEWRFIWLLYVAENHKGYAAKTFVKSANLSALSPVTRAWVARARGGRGEQLTIDQQHDMPYVDVGRTLYGAL